MKTMIGVARIAGLLIGAQIAGIVLANEGPQAGRESARAAPPAIQVPTPPKTRPSTAEIETRPSPTLPSLTPKRNLSRRVQPKNERGWMARILEGYPVRAKREGLQGTVAVSVIIDASGRSNKCEVTHSSGHASLDDSACKNMLRFSRFEPALDPQGNPIAMAYGQQINYQQD